MNGTLSSSLRLRSFARNRWLWLAGLTALLFCAPVAPWAADTQNCSAQETNDTKVRQWTSRNGQYTVNAGVTSEMRGHLRHATRFVEGLTSRTIANEVTLDRVTIVNDPEDTRGNYYRWPAPKITLSPEHTTPRYVHELVHHVETSFGPERWKYVHTRFAAWTKGAELQPLGGNYSSYEQYLARTDGRRWPGDEKYAGKVKHGTMEPEEIITQSAEDLAENPGRFAQEYPELFDLVVNVLRGKRP